MDTSSINERIVQLMNHLSVTPGVFADKIGVQRSGITHIINGRNKPSLDMINKIIDSYPDVSLEWLLKGKGQISSTSPRILNMQKNTIPSEPVIDNSLKNTLFEDNDVVKRVEVKPVEEAKYTHQDFIEVKKEIEPQKINEPTLPKNDNTTIAPPPIQYIKEIVKEKKITKVMVFYNDNTFEELSGTKNE